MRIRSHVENYRQRGGHQAAEDTPAAMLLHEMLASADAVEKESRATCLEEEATRRARREGGDREVARRLQRESERDCEER